MRRPRYLDFDCPVCAHAEERFVDTTDDGAPTEVELCGSHIYHDGCEGNGSYMVCDATLVMREIGKTLMAPLAGKDVKDNHEDASRQRERLEKRQDEHWKRRGRDEAIETERSFLKRMGADGAGGVR